MIISPRCIIASVRKAEPLRCEGQHVTQTVKLEPATPLHRVKWALATFPSHSLQGKSVEAARASGQSRLQSGGPPLTIAGTIFAIRNAAPDVIYGSLRRDFRSDESPTLSNSPVEFAVWRTWSVCRSRAACSTRGVIVGVIFKSARAQPAPLSGATSAESVGFGALFPTVTREPAPFVSCRPAGTPTFCTGDSYN